MRIDKKPRAGARPHTTGLIVKEAAEAWNIPTRLTRKIRGVRVYGPSLAHLDLESPGYYFLATDTAGVLDWLAARAEKSGARLRFGTAYRGAAHEAGSIALTETNIRTRYLVGADGPRSCVARDEPRLGRCRVWPNRFSHRTDHGRIGRRGSGRARRRYFGGQWGRVHRCNQ